MDQGPQPPPRANRRRPTWLVRARAPGSAEWRDRRVAARSGLQAEAILRRLGFIVEALSARVVDAPPEDSASLRAAPGPLLCVKCGYLLDGLVVRDAAIECPECGFGQIVLAFVPETAADAFAQSRGRRAKSGGAFVGGCLTGVVLVVLGLVMLIEIASL